MMNINFIRFCKRALSDVLKGVNVFGGKPLAFHSSLTPFACPSHFSAASAGESSAECSCERLKMHIEQSYNGNAVLLDG